MVLFLKLLCGKIAFDINILRSTKLGTILETEWDTSVVPISCLLFQISFPNISNALFDKASFQKLLNKFNCNKEIVLEYSDTTTDCETGCFSKKS